MAIREGRCPNCGSIINVETEKDNHCVFCWAKVDPAKAISLAEDVGDYVFPNEKFDPPAESAKSAALSAYRNGVQYGAKQRRTTSAQPVAKKPKEQRLSAAEQVAKLNESFAMPELKVNKRVLVTALSVVAIVVVAIVAWAVPSVHSRNIHRTEIINKIQPDKNALADIALQGMHNTKLIAVDQGSGDAKKAEAILKAYTEAYTAAYKLDKEPTNLELQYFSKTKSFVANRKSGTVKVSELK